MKKFALLFSVILLFAYPLFAEARTIEEAEVRTAVLNWIYMGAPCGEKLGTQISDVKLYQGVNGGDIGYYLVTLAPNGWVVLPASDDYWPIQLFSASVMDTDRYEKTMWFKLLKFSSQIQNNTKSMVSNQPIITNTNNKDII